MDDEYRDAYRQIYELRAKSRPELRRLARTGLPWSLIIHDAIEYAAVEAPVPLREDGKALLALNFEDLVVLPLIMVGRIDESQLIDYVRVDINLLVQRAATRDDAAEELSGHTLIDSLSENWRDLRLAEFRLWED